ncbi:hypothetical protein BSKO_09414 [Bryopsis sp. KO-2023]|nr:hypothetical protein BSKO_09414 [Bryopsis sp. KO-2023]
MTLEQKMKATYNKWMAEKFLEHLMKDTSASRNRRGSSDVLNGVLTPLGDFATCESPTPTSPPPDVSAASPTPAGKVPSKEIARPEFDEKTKTPAKGSLVVLHEESHWDGGDGYISDGSDYADYVEESLTQKSISSKKRRLHRIGSAMDAVESRLSETLLSSPPTSNLQLNSGTHTAPPDFTFATPLQEEQEWDGGDAFFSETSDMSPTHSSGVPVEGQFENLRLEDDEPAPPAPPPPPPSNGEAVPMVEEWEGGDGYFSGSDYGDYKDI